MNVDIVNIFRTNLCIRKSILVTCPLALIYNILVASVGGTVLESVNIVSAAIGIYRYRKQ